MNKFQMSMLDRSHIAAFKRAAAICVTSDDYAASSRLAGHLDGRTTEIPPPSLLRPAGRPAFRDGPGLHVGFLGRIVEEKGLEYLVAGFRQLGPDARLVIGGDFASVAGGSVVDKVMSAIDGDPRVRMLGFVPDEDVADFYASLDVFALTSINSLEAFGIVQVEALMLGIPSLAIGPARSARAGHPYRLRTHRPSARLDAITQGLRHLGSATLDVAAGAAAAQKLFLADNIVEQHAELFTSLLATS